MNILKMLRKPQNKEENQLLPLIQAINNLSTVYASQHTPQIQIEKEFVNVENPINEDLKSQVEALQLQLTTIKQERDWLLEKLNDDQFIANEELKERYIQLLDFAFRNIDPFTTIDVLQARHYYENIIKK